MIAAYVKEGRLAKGYTQKELSDLSNVSVRSIQRIENAEIIPRSYTIKTLFDVLEIPVEKIQQVNPAGKKALKINKEQKVILTIAIPVVVFLAVWAFISQSATVPETTFEAVILALITIVILIVFFIYMWRS